MNDDDNLLELLASDDKPFKSTTETTSNAINGTMNKKQNKDEGLYDNLDIPLVKVDPGSFKTTSKYFTIAYTVRQEIPQAYIDKLISIVKILFAKGYTLRAINDKNDVLLKQIKELENKKIELFLAWKPKNHEELTGVTMFKPNKLGYGVAKNSHVIFNKLHPALRASLSAKVHSLLGPDVNAPVSFVLAYSETGSEGYVKGMDFKKEGDLVFYIKVCGDSNIPIFNIKKEDAIQRFSELLQKD